MPDEAVPPPDTQGIRSKTYLNCKVHLDSHWAMLSRKRLPHAPQHGHVTAVNTPSLIILNYDHKVKNLNPTGATFQIIDVLPCVLLPGLFNAELIQVMLQQELTRYQRPNLAILSWAYVTKQLELIKQR